DPLCQRPTLVRARAKGRSRGLSVGRCGRRAVDARSRARTRPRNHTLRFRPRRQAQRLQRAVAAGGLTGILLVGGASRRLGSPRALASFDGETLATRAWRTLGAACDERIAVG